jgi:hypothetical protein
MENIADIIGILMAIVYVHQYELRLLPPGQRLSAGMGLLALELVAK